MADLPVDPDLPPISRLPDHERVLDRFLTTGVRPWGGESTGLPLEVTALFWAVAIADAGFAAWLVAVRTAVISASGWPFDVATLGAPDVVLVMTLANVAIVAPLAVPTRGLSRASAVPLGLLVAGCVCGAIALLGVAALLVITAVVVGALVGVLAFAATRI